MLGRSIVQIAVYINQVGGLFNLIYSIMLKFVTIQDEYKINNIYVSIIFFREFQLMASTPDNNSFSLEQYINRFLV